MRDRIPREGRPWGPSRQRRKVERGAAKTPELLPRVVLETDRTGNRTARAIGALEFRLTFGAVTTTGLLVAVNRTGSVNL